ncbi:MAG: ATP-dependent DNA helicase, partial [Firmicutes bacterium]|nr:ATP-dependent DNA helicase [Bacillota bacterium]
VKATYQGRQQSLEAVCEMLHQVVSAKEGHYMVFFPSFAYLEQVMERFTEQYPGVPVLRQESQMSEEERAKFLQQFEEDDGSLLGFCVLGGVFSEGIDLRGQSLIGVVVVSVGIPQIGTERDLIREHLEEAIGKGYEYAYMYPGIGKVFQAAGRVIRTEEDEGIILLLDDRFDQQRYYQLYPPDWFPVSRVSPENLPGELDAFWKRDER